MKKPRKEKKRKENKINDKEETWKQMRRTTNDFIHRSATAFGKAVVVEWRRISSSFHGELVHDAIQFIGGDAGSNMFRCQIQDFTCHSTNSSHLFNLVRFQLPDEGAPSNGFFTPRNTVLSVVWPRDRRGNDTTRTERIVRP